MNVPVLAYLASSVSGSKRCSRRRLRLPDWDGRPVCEGLSRGDTASDLIDREERVRNLAGYGLRSIKSLVRLNSIQVNLRLRLPPYKAPGVGEVH